jgi:hypothetical protein
MIETVLSLGGLVVDVFNIVSGIKHGKEFNKLLSQLEEINVTTERLSSNIWYVPDLLVVSDTTRTRQQKIDNL